MRPAIPRGARNPSFAARRFAGPRRRTPRFRLATASTGIAVRPREARRKPTETIMNLLLANDDAFELHHESSPTDRFIYEMQLYGHRSFQDEPDPRPLPEEPVVQSALTAIFDALFEMLGDTRLEPDL
jgi:hypothetical protein